VKTDLINKIKISTSVFTPSMAFLILHLASALDKNKHNFFKTTSLSNLKIQVSKTTKPEVKTISLR